MCSKRHAVIASGFYDSGIDLLGQLLTRSKAIVDSFFKPVGVLLQLSKSQRIRLFGCIRREYVARQKQTGKRLFFKREVVPHLERFSPLIPKDDAGCYTTAGLESDR